GVPGRATRLWVPVAATAAAGLLVSTQVGGVSAAAAAVRRGAADLWRTCLAFVGDWVLEPLRGIYNTIRHREERLALMGKDSLKGDLDSLERMVVSFARDHGATDEAELARVAAAVQHGDLTAVLQNYEDEIRRPFRNTVAGDLVRSVLIQVQKAKVDLELAMSALDKLLRANELNFAFLAVVPALLLTYTAVRQGVRLAVRVLRGPQRRSFALVRSGLREVERLLNRANRTTTTTATASSGSSSDRLTLVELGLLVCEIQTLRGCVGQMPRSARGAFREDLAELGDPAWSVSQRLATCRRM
ncbi:nuclear control of ATP synthase 2, partial [Zopfochytrium polystomum]